MITDMTTVIIAATVIVAIKEIRPCSVHRDQDGADIGFGRMGMAGAGYSPSCGYSDTRILA